MVRSTLAAVMIALMPGSISAQVAAPPPAAPPDDTPSVKVGGTIYADYTYTVSPESTDADGNPVNPSAFNVTRSYINLTGSLSHIVAFRITPDITRETGGDSSLDGSLVFRLKYAFAQFNLDDWLAEGSWARLGIQQTPWVDFEEGIYRYRFQGTVFVEREGFLSSSDAGASFHYDLPSGYGDLHAGYYNGENYNHAEVNDQKAFQIRGSIRPLPRGSVWQGLRGHVFYDADHYVKSADRLRFVVSATFEHRYVNAGFDYLRTRDRTSAGAAEVDGEGFSIWATPRSPTGWEALLRYDRFEPNSGVDRSVRARTIAGVAYWFPHQGNVATAVLLDYDGQTFDHFTTPRPSENKVAVHALMSF
jgi:hypothetical protein